MTSHRGAWMDEIAEQIKQIPLAEFVKIHNISEAEAVAYLLEISKGLTVKRTAWWPVAVRLHQAGVPVEEIGRRFLTNHRRIRSALSREGLLDIQPEDLRVVQATAATPAPEPEPAPIAPQDTTPAAAAAAPELDAQDDAADAPKRRKVVLRKVVQAVVPSAATPAPAPEPMSASLLPTNTAQRSRRVVRPDPIRPEPEPEAAPPPEPPRRRRSRKDALHGSVREVDPSQIDVTPLLEAERSKPQKPHPLLPRPATPVAQPPAAAAPPTPPEPAPTEKAPRARRVRSAEAPAPAVKPAAPATVAIGAGHLGWRIRLDGKEQPLVVVAGDILGAVALFEARLGAAALVRADIYPSPLLG